MATNIFLTPIGQIIQPNAKIITIDHNTLVPQALKILGDNKIYCAPVVSGNKVIGMIDLVDIVAFIVEIFDDQKLLQRGFYAKIAGEKIWNSEHASEISNLSQKNPLIAVKQSISLKEALHVMNEMGCRRLLVEGNDNQLIGILSQSTILEFLHKHLDSLPNGKKTIKELNLGSDVVVSVRDEDRIIDAFKLMSKYRITSVAIVLSDGKLLSNVSAKDLRVIVNDPDLFSNLYKTAREFITLSRQLQIETTFAASITCHETEVLEKVIKKLIASKIHRIYIINASYLPVRVVSLTDILKVVNH
jgi:5'-AMP-activated protein kinase regulatory gamma subunit